MESNMSRNSSNNFGIKNYSCFMALDNPDNRDPASAPNSGTPSSAIATGHSCSTGGDGYLAKVLCNLEEAATYDKECCAKIEDLKEHQKNLSEQIKDLETREHEGVKLLKKADVMWCCMEDAYKRKIEETIESQKQHLREQREFDQSLSKWRQHRKTLEGQVKNLDKCRFEIKGKIDAKIIDLKFINTEIGDLKKKIQTTENDAETLNKSLISKQKIAAGKQSQIAEKIQELQEELDKEKQEKADKEADGRNCIKQARDDLQKICTKLLQKRMENEDLKAEREAILSEIELLKASSVQCQDRCDNRKAALEEELAFVLEDIANYRLKCTQCHKCVDTVDVRRFCTDCPKCMEERDCLYNDENCTDDPENECVCMETKRRFLDNIFENMYNVLSSQIKTKNGKALAERILESLSKSRNGKLNDPTRKAIQEFILAVVKKNLNLTIIGGAVKTRCELEPEAYEQLMVCLETVEVETPEKEDKGTISKKEPCKRWGVGECNCPKGPAGCVCVSKAPPTAKDPSPCPPRLPEDFLDIGQAQKCPHRDNMDCGADCAVPPTKSPLPDRIARSYRPPPCGGESCAYVKTARIPPCGSKCADPPSRAASKMNVSSNVEREREPKANEGKTTTASTPYSKNVKAAQCGPICKDPPGFKIPSKLIEEANVEREREAKPAKKAQCLTKCMDASSFKTSSDLDISTMVEKKGSQQMAGQMSQCSKECSESHSKVKKAGPRRSKDSSTFTKNMRAAQCALEPSATQDYVPSSSPIPYRKLNAKGTKASNADWKASSNVGTKVRKSYSPDQNDRRSRPRSRMIEEVMGRFADVAPIEKVSYTVVSDVSSINSPSPYHCDCELRKKRKETGSQSYHTALISKKSSDHGNERRGIIKEKHCFCSDYIEVDLMPSKVMDVPRVQAEVLSGAYVDRGTEPFVNFTNEERVALEKVVSNLTKPHISKHLKVIIPNDKGEVKQEFTEITVTSSGSMAMALDEKIIEEIGNLTQENQVLLGVLRKTFSGHYALEFNTSAASSAVSRQVIVKKTDSAHIIMEIHKDLIETLRPGANTQIISKVPSMSIGNCRNKCYETGHVQAEYKIGAEEVKSNYDITRQSFKNSINQCKECATGGKKSSKKIKPNHLISSNRARAAAGSLQSYKTGRKKQKYATKTSNILYLRDEFQKMFEHGHTGFNVTIVGGNGLKSIIRARITKTQSRHIAVDVKALKYIGQIANRLKNYPVSLIKTKSKYLLKLRRNNENANALLRRNSIGDMLVVLRDPILNYPGNMSEVLEINETMFVARVKGIQLDDSNEPSLLLRVTSSGNFVFVFDKEFEQTYMKKVNRFGDDKCPVNQSINESGVLILDFKSCDIDSNGLLFKTRSGKLKILTASPNYIGELQQLFRSTIQTNVHKLFSKLYREHFQTKCCSDTLLNGKVEMYEQRTLLSDQAAILKKTAFTDEKVIKDIEEKAVETALSLSSVESHNTCNKRVPTSCLMQSGESYKDDQYNYGDFSPGTSIRYMTAENSPSSSCNRCGSNHYLNRRCIDEDSPSDGSPTGILRTTDTKLKFKSTFKKHEHINNSKPNRRCNDEDSPSDGSPTVILRTTDTKLKFKSTFKKHEHINKSKPNRRCSDEDSPSDGSPTGILRTTHTKLKFKSTFKKHEHINKSISWKDIVDKNTTNFKIDFYNRNIKETYIQGPRPDLSCLDYLDSMPPQLPSFLRDYQYSV